MQNRKNALLVLAAAGAAIGIQGVATAQPFVINISGATLLQNFVSSEGSTNDFIDVDGDGDFGSGDVDQLATGPISGGSFPAGTWWVVQYRIVGSVNGFQELVDWGRSNWATGIDTGPELLASNATDGAIHNRQTYITAGVASNPIYNANNPGGAPVRSFQMTNGSDLAYEATTGAGVNTGIQIDLAPVDVPGRWAVRGPESTARGGAPLGFDLNPGQAGYGRNPIVTRNNDGTTNGFDHLLANLGPRNLFDPMNPGAADNDTIFDTQLAFAPIAVLTNYGTGLQQILMSDLRHMVVTGRMSTGENLTQITRDSGSGTRNGYNNSIDTDPSYGIGENTGGFSNTSPSRIVGPNYIPGQKGGSGALETTLFNTRLGIGYSGAERGFVSGWLTGGRAEVLAVKNDHLPDATGAATFNRPTANNVFDNTADGGYRIGGPSVIASIGDPRAEPIADGGDNNGNPAMSNPHAAAYLNNLTRSIENFIAIPNSPSNFFMPGEVVATQLAITNGVDFVPGTADPIAWVANPSFNQNLQNSLRNVSVLGDQFHIDAGNFNNPYAAFGNSVRGNGNLAESDSRAGKVPTRTTGQTYSDGVTGGSTFYRDQSGATHTYGANLPLRNLIAGDFNGNGIRDLGDATGLVAAWRQRNGGPAWVAPSGNGALLALSGTTGQSVLGTEAIIEVLGDFNNDGNFGTIGGQPDRTDARYWADGLAMSAGLLNRCAGFEAIDNAFFTQTGNNNFFGTTLANGTYDAGDSTADVAGAAGTTPGYVPVGADGSVDADDIDYVYAQFNQNPRVLDGALNWDNIDEAFGGDLSADINGDLVIDQADITKILDILETTLGDVNLDGTVDSVDEGIAMANLGNPGGWAQGDVNGDGTVTQADLDIIAPPVCCLGNANGDSIVDFDDIVEILGNWLEGTVPSTPNNNGDANCDGNVDFDDIVAVLGQWLNPC